MKQVTFDIGDALKKLGRELDVLAPRVEAEFQDAIKDLAYAAYASVVSEAQSKLDTTRQDYLKGLKFEELGDHTYLIMLEGNLPNKIEQGWGPFDMTPGLLGSQKHVSVGPRAGEAWVQHTKATKETPSHRFAHVPIQHNPNSAAAQKNDLAESIKAMTARNARGRKQKLTSIFKGLDGAPLQGKVAVGTSDNPLTDQLVKYQQVSKAANGKDVVSSVYITYRTVSDAGKPWIHPGFDGVHAFDHLERDLDRQITEIIKALI